VRASRWALATAGVFAALYALAGATRDPDVSPGGVLVFLGAVLVAHDGVVLPIAIGVGALAGRLVGGRLVGGQRPGARGPGRGPARAAVHAALFASAVLLVIGLPLALGYGREPGSPSVLPRDYGRGLGLALATVWLAAGAAVATSAVGRPRDASARDVSARPDVGRSSAMDDDEDTFPEPVSDPEAEGLPGTADDDSTAYDDVDSPREADGPDPAALPGDRPLAMDRFGTSAEEARLGEPLDYKLAQEEPDVSASDEPARSRGDDVDLADDVTDRPDPDAGLADAAVPDPDGSPVSEYDIPDPAYDRVGRLVEPDEGAHEDTEPDAVAYDAGAAGGGPSAEEQAMHVVEDDA